MNVIYSDSTILVLDKPGGLLSVPGRGPDKQDCVVSRARKLFPDIIEQPAVHRLDMYTSGILLLARTTTAHKNLSIQFAQRLTQKYYIALLEGPLKEESGRIALKFRLDTDNRPYQMYDPEHGKLGITLWRKIGNEGLHTRIEFNPLTGRTHQLRVHAAHKLGLNVPIVGDRLYGRGSEGEQMMLHATSLSFTHPQNGETVTFVSKPPF